MSVSRGLPVDNPVRRRESVTGDPWALLSFLRPSAGLHTAGMHTADPHTLNRRPPTFV